MFRCTPLLYVYRLNRLAFHHSGTLLCADADNQTRHRSADVFPCHLLKSPHCISFRRAGRTRHLSALPAVRPGQTSGNPYHKGSIRIMLDIRVGGVLPSSHWGPFPG